MQLLDYYDKKGLIDMNVQTILEELPKRFHEDFMECIVDEESIKNLRKVYDYFLAEIIDELTQEEKDNIFIKIG